jgi:hypothetical protein
VKVTICDDTVMPSAPHHRIQSSSSHSTSSSSSSSDGKLIRMQQSCSSEEDTMELKVPEDRIAKKYREDFQSFGWLTNRVSPLHLLMSLLKLKPGLRS